MIINLSRIDFGGVATGGKAKPEESFDVQPTTAEQTITPTEGSVFSGGTVRAVTSSIDSNIQPENIKEGVSILGVAGTLSAGSGAFVVPNEVKFAYSKFTEIPSNWDFSNVTDMSHMFEYCQQLTSIPQLNTSMVTDMSNMLGYTQLTTIPLLDTSNVSNMHSMFANCKHLTTIPQLNTSMVTDMSQMFSGCSNLTTIPQLDTSDVTNMSDLFYYCSKLTTIPQLNTSMVTDMSNIFAFCSKLTTVEGIDFSGFTSPITQLFGNNSNKSDIKRFIVNGKINVSITNNYSIKALTAIDYDSVKSILTAADRTDNTNAKRLYFNRTMTDQNGELAALVSSCTSKGWTITGLTLQ